MQFFKSKKDVDSFGSIQEWMPVKTIKNNMIVLKNGVEVAVFRVEPINFKLKSKLEQMAVLEGYKYFLKRCNFDMQIVMQTRKADISKHVSAVRRNTCNDVLLKECAEDYINFINGIAAQKSGISRDFYIAVRGDGNVDDKFQKIKEGLTACENNVYMCCNDELKRLICGCINKRLVNLGG